MKSVLTAGSLLLIGLIFLTTGCTSWTGKSDDIQQQIKLVEQAQKSIDNKDYLAARSYLEKYTAISQHTPATLWLGVQAEYAMGNQHAVSDYVQQLRENYPDSDEYQAYQEMLRRRFIGH